MTADLKATPANATGWMHEIFPALKDFSWQRGYGAFTVSQSNVEQVRHYIAKQKEHHTKVSFRDEFIQFLKANGIEYDERYVGYHFCRLRRLWDIQLSSWGLRPRRLYA